MANDDHEVESRHDEDEVRVGTETASARSYMRHVLFDLDSSGNELEDSRRNNLEVNGLHAQEILGIEELAAALHGREAIAAQHQEREFIQEQHSYEGNSTPRPVPSHQQSIQFQEPILPYIPKKPLQPHTVPCKPKKPSQHKECLNNDNNLD